MIEMKERGEKLCIIIDGSKSEELCSGAGSVDKPRRWKEMSADEGDRWSLEL